MIASRQRRTTLFVVFWLSLLLMPTYGVASPNATIINGNVHLRETYPKFGISTLYKFKFVEGRILTVISNGSRVEVISKRIVADSQEWFETIYMSGASRYRGWIYGGPTGERKYIRLDAGVEDRLPVVGFGENPVRPTILANAWLFLSLPSAYAQDHGDVVESPPINTDPVRTLGLGTGYVVIFIVALVATRKLIFPESITGCLVVCFCVLLILGFLSETTFAGLMGNFVTQ